MASQFQDFEEGPMPPCECGRCVECLSREVHRLRTETIRLQAAANLTVFMQAVSQNVGSGRTTFCFEKENLVILWRLGGWVWCYTVFVPRIQKARNPEEFAKATAAHLRGGLSLQHGLPCET